MWPRRSSGACARSRRNRAATRSSRTSGIDYSRAARTSDRRRRAPRSRVNKALAYGQASAGRRDRASRVTRIKRRSDHWLCDHQLGRDGRDRHRRTPAGPPRSRPPEAFNVVSMWGWRPNLAPSRRRTSRKTRKRARFAGSFSTRPARFERATFGSGVGSPSSAQCRSESEIACEKPLFEMT